MDYHTILSFELTKQQIGEFTHLKTYRNNTHCYWYVYRLMIAMKMIIQQFFPGHCQPVNKAAVNVSTQVLCAPCALCALRGDEGPPVGR